MRSSKPVPFIALDSATKPNANGGFTLIEVLVALVILAVGLLGIAALYVDSLRASRTALLRTQAIAIASDLADRIRANRDACTAAGCAYVGVFNGSEGRAPIASCETTVGCLPEQLAANDITRWSQGAAMLLPGFSGTIDFVAGPPNQYTITVSWTEPNEGGDYRYELTVYT
jgi:type IV pilus assembly protein PilV